MGFADVFLKSTISNVERRIVGETGAAIRRQSSSGVDALGILSGLRTNAESATAQAIRRVTTAEIRTPEFNSILARIRIQDPVVAESIEKNLNSFNLNNGRGLAKAQEMINSVTREYSVSEEAFARKVTSARGAIDESARKAAERKETLEIQDFINEVRAYNPDLGNKLVTKVSTLEKIEPERARGFMRNLIARYDSGRFAAQSYERLQGTQPKGLYEDVSFKPFASLRQNEGYSSALDDSFGLNTFDSWM